MSEQKDNLLLRRAVRVLDALAAGRGPLRFVQVQALLGGISPSSVSSILGTLCETGVVRKLPAGGYVLTQRVRFWAGRVKDRLDLAGIARPEMERLSALLQATVIVFSFSGDAMLCLDSVQDPASPSLARPGSVCPVRLQVIGSLFVRGLLAAGRDEELLAVLGFDPRKHPRALVARMVKRARRDGYMYDEATFFVGSHRFSVPIRHGDETVGVLGFGCTAERLRPKGAKKKMVAALKAAAERIGGRLPG